MSPKDRAHGARRPVGPQGNPGWLRAFVLACALIAACRSSTGEGPPELVVTETLGAAEAPDGAPAQASGAAGTRAGTASAAESALPAAGTELGRRIAAGRDPAYPTMSRKLLEEGSVDLAIEVGNDGGLRGVRVVSSSGHARLDEAALAAVRAWTFKPRTGAEPSKVYRQRFVFRLKPTQR